MAFPGFRYLVNLFAMLQCLIGCYFPYHPDGESSLGTLCEAQIHAGNCRCMQGCGEIRIVGGSPLGAPLDPAGFVHLGAGLSLRTPQRHCCKIFGEFPIFISTQGVGGNDTWALPRGEAVAVALALTWPPGEREVSS